jgi:uncharacterized protein YndB with AHSA1/START domain
MRDLVTVSVHSDRRHQFGVSRDELWEAVTEIDQYRHWWPWLRSFDGRAFAAGERWGCVVKPQLPYTLEFEIVLEEVRRAERAYARLTGDIEGWAELVLADAETGSVLRLRSDLTAGGGPARWVEMLAGPLARRGHDWVLDNGIRQFRVATGV